MSQTVADMGGRKVRFNHGLAVSEGQPSVDVSNRALRLAIVATDNESDAAVFHALWQRLTNAEQYTEGHHEVSVEVSQEEVNHLHLAHMVAIESIPEFDAAFAESLRENKKALPTSA